MNLDKRQVRRQFDRSSGSYDRVAEMQRDIVTRLCRHLPAKASTILDVGCGTGFGLSGLRKQYPFGRIIGADLAPKMLEVAQFSGAGAELLVADMEAMPLANDSFDLCLSSSAIQWCDSAAALTEIARVSRPGGCVLISSFLDGTLRSWRDLWGRQNQQTFLSVDELSVAFSQAGLEVHRLWEEKYTQRFLSFDAAVASIRDLGAGNASPNRGLMTREQLCDVKRKAESIIEGQGAIELEYRIVFAHASKPVL